MAVKELKTGTLAADGRRLDRHGAGRIVRWTARRAGIGELVTRTRCGTRSSPRPRMPGSLCVIGRKPPRTRTRTTMRYERTGGRLDRHATYNVGAYLAGAAR